MPVISRIGAAAARGFGLFGAIAAIKDAYFNYVTLLLPGNGTNGAQNNTFLDSSSNAFTITRNGNTTQGNFSPFSQTGWGNYFNGTTDALSIGGSGAWAALSTGNFTVECWIYIASNTATQVIADARGTTSSVQAWQFYTNSSGKLVFMYGSASLTGATTIAANQWVHVAAVRSGTTITVYINGTADGTATSSANLSGGATTYLGRTFDTAGTVWYAGYISNFRTVIGTAVYTANFTPSTTPLTAISGTSLLTCQSNRFLDSSSNAYAITTVGTPSVQAFSPFAPTAAWSASTNGGSGYFDGSGDYLTVPDNTAFDFGSGNFTVEMWVYPTAVGQSSLTLLYCKPNASGYSPIAIGQAVSGYGAVVYASSTGTSWNLASGVSAGTMIANAWNHVAVCRSGTNLYAFVNGALGSTTAVSTTALVVTTGAVSVGSSLGTANTYATGYMSDVRAIKGTALYTAAFTPPTAPLTAISGTSLLLSATNGAIVDATAKNDLETVGNAQISTTQSKFGGSSMYFDGTGDQLSSPNSLFYDFGGGDFTIEAWLYPTTASQLAVAARGQNTGFVGWILSTTNFLATTNSSSWDITITFTNALTANSWNHIAIVRYGNVYTAYKNGVANGTTTVSGSIVNGTAAFVIGQRNGQTDYSGYIDDLRITKGIARYTSNFTPPTSAFPLQ